MLQSLKAILDIQEFDMKMIRLMRLKRERMKELEHIDNLRQELRAQQAEKESEIAELNRTTASQEIKIHEIKEKIKKLESRQASVKKVDEFNAIKDSLPNLRARVGIPELLIPPLRELSPDELDVLQLAHNYGHVETILNKSLASDLDTSTILLKLAKSGYLRTE